MKRIIHMVLWMAIGLLLLASANAEQIENIKVTYPTANESLSGQLVVRGVAEIPPGKYLWILVRRVDFEPLWWPQRQAQIKPTTNEWKAQAVLGGPQDIGREFDIGAAIVDRKSHNELMEYWKKAMETGDWRPISLPDGVSTIKTVKVIKSRQ